MESANNYLAKTGWVTISTANSNLDGSGAMGLVFEAGGSFGAIIKTVIIKAQTTTGLGFIRLFIDDGDVKSLFMEINVPYMTKSSRDLSFYAVIPMNHRLESGHKLYASTEKNDTFNVIAEALEIEYHTDFDTNIVKYTSQTGVGKIDTANGNLDGSGAIEEILVAAGDDGCEITSIIIKALETVTPGMVRLFIQDTVPNDPVLFCEVMVPAVTQSSATKSFSSEVISNGSFSLQPGFKVLASTQNSEDFSVTITAASWTNP